MSISIKTQREIELMRVAGQIVAKAHKVAEEIANPGVTTKQIDDAVNQFILDSGAYPSFKKQRNKYSFFPGAACISVNDEIVHGIPSDRVLLDGDIVSVDIGAEYDGYHCDAARTFAVGNIGSDLQRLIDTAEQSFWSGVEFARDGMRIGDIANAVQNTVESAGFTVVKELIGHGIGSSLHEPPDIPNYGAAGRGPRLFNGMAICVEPMINLGEDDIYLAADGWTVLTDDGLASAHYENTILITDGDPEILTLLKDES